MTGGGVVKFNWSRSTVNHEVSNVLDLPGLLGSVIARNAVTWQSMAYREVLDLDIKHGLLRFARNDSGWWMGVLPFAHSSM